MTEDETHALIGDYFEHLRARDPVLLAGDFAPDATVESPSIGIHQGRDAIEQGYRGWFSSFPDLLLTLEDLVVQGGAAALAFHAAGTHQQEFLGLPATGKRIEFRGVYLLKLSNHQIVYERRIYDFTGLLIKLGVLKVKPT